MAGIGETFVGAKTAGVGAASFTQEFYEAPIETTNELKEQLDAIQNLDRWPEYLAAIADSYERRMRLSNPYENGTGKFENFRGSYYAGIALFEIGLAVGTSGTAAAAKQSTRASRLADIVRGTRLARAGKVALSGYDTVTAPSDYVQTRLATSAARGASFGVEAAQRVYSRAPSVGSMMRTRRALDDLDSDTIESFSPATQRRLGDIVARADDPEAALDAVRAVDDLDGDRRVRALDYLADGGTRRAELLADFDRDALENLFPGRCGVAAVGSVGVPAGGAPAHGSTTRFYSVGALQSSSSCLDDPEAFRNDVEAAFDANGNVDSGDAADVVNKVGSLDDDVKRGRARYILEEAGGDGGAELLADADADTLDSILSFDVDASGGDLPDNLGDKVRASLAEEYGRGHFSRDGWAGEVYDVDSDAAVTGEIADDIDALNDAENVEGLGRLLSKEAGEESSGGGSYLAEVRQLSPSASDDPTKGAALELRAARAEAPAPDSSDVLRLDYEPEVDFTELSESELQDVAQKVYGQRDASLVEDYLVNGDESRDIELDAFRDSDDGSMELYVESKVRVYPEDSTTGTA